MAQFSVNAQRFDPYKNFKFRVKWDGRYVAGVSKVGALKRTTEVVEHREGGDPSSGRKSPGRSKYEAITLERGVTHDKEFEQWANKVWNFGAGLGAEVSLKDFRKDIIIEVYNEAGQLALAYKVFRCWVSEFQALPDLDANANAVAIQHIKLENEGWERDYEVSGAERTHVYGAGVSHVSLDRDRRAPHLGSGREARSCGPSLDHSGRGLPGTNHGATGRSQPRTAGPPVVPPAPVALRSGTARVRRVPAMPRTFGIHPGGSGDVR